jgi:hypothetical protein
VATPPGSTVQTGVNPTTGFPFESADEAVKAWVAPRSMLALEGSTEVLFACCSTVTVALPLCPLAVAVIDALPFVCAVTRPLAASTLAMFLSPLVQANVIPPSACPPESLACAVSCAVALNALSSAGAPPGVETATVATVCETEIASDAALPPELAVICAGPLATAATSPWVSTVATPGAPELQVKTASGMAAPRASIALACSCSVAPRNVSGAGFVSAIATDAAAGIVTATLAAPLLPPLAAWRVAVPIATAVTRPFATVAKLGWSLVQRNCASAIALPFASSAEAASCAVAPRSTLAVAGETVTLATCCATCTLSVALKPPAVAAMVALPFPAAVTRPCGSTVTTPDALEVQVKTASGMGAPRTSSEVACSCTVAPTLASAPTLVSTICTLAASGTTTVRCACPDAAPLLATRSVSPTPSAVARPPLLIDATPALLAVQASGAPAITCPSASVTLPLS